MAHTWQVCRHFITSSQQSFIYCEKTFLRFWRKWYSRLLRNGAKTEDRNQEEAFWRRVVGVVGVVDVVGAHNQKKLNCFVRIFSLSRSTSMLPLLLSFLSASILLCVPILESFCVCLNPSPAWVSFCLSERFCALQFCVCCCGVNDVDDDHTVATLAASPGAKI